METQKKDNPSEKKFLCDGGNYSSDEEEKNYFTGLYGQTHSNKASGINPRQGTHPKGNERNHSKTERPEQSPFDSGSHLGGH